MKHFGACHCGNCEVVVDSPIGLRELAPRVCDCEYCQNNPSAMVSSPEWMIEIHAKPSTLLTATNGSGQATFYHCKHCHQLLAVGATLAGVSLGAVNALLMGNLNQFAEPIAIQPRLLSPDEKAARWVKIWGRLKIACA